MDQSKLERSKRACLRSIKKHRDTVKGMLSPSPSDSVTESIKTYLDLWFADSLKTIDSGLLNLINDEDYETTAVLEKAESAITVTYDTLLHDYGACLAKVKVIVAKLQSYKRRSSTFDKELLNASFIHTLPNPLSKLPGIKVSMFDGNVRVQSYTNW